MGKTLTKSDAQEAIDNAYGIGAYKVIKLYKALSKDLRVQVICCRCNGEEEYSYKHFKKGNARCICSSPEGLEKIAKKYAEELYIEPYDGLIVGEELESFIKTCVMYDMPALLQNTDFIDMVENFLLDIYEEKKATKCKRCGRYFPARIVSKGICLCCRKGV